MRLDRPAYVGFPAPQLPGALDATLAEHEPETYAGNVTDEPEFGLTVLSTDNGEPSAVSPLRARAARPPRTR